MVDRWDNDTINEEKLKYWHNKYKNYFLDKKKRSEILSKMTLKYWVNKIIN